MNPEFDKNQIISKLQIMPENELSKKIIIPLLEALGYHKVEFFGGPSEEGKDIVCWEYDKMGDLKLIVAQVKHFKFTSKAADTKGLQTVVNQLITCFKKTLLYTDKTTHLPSEAFLITTHLVNTKSLQSRFGNYQDLPDSKIKIIDGYKLATLILQHIPSIANDYFGINVEISSALNDTLNNDILLTALGYQKKKDLRHIYTDIDFSIGKNSTELFFNSDFHPAKETIKLGDHEWESFKNICKIIEKDFPLDFMQQTFAEIEHKYLIEKEKFDIWHEEFGNLNNKLLALRIEQESLHSDKNNNKNEIENGNREIDATTKKLELLEKVPRPYYKAAIDGEILVNAIIRKRTWIENKVKEFNGKKPTIDEIKSFIEQCKSILDNASLLFSSFNFFSSIGCDRSKVIRNNFESTRFKLPIQDVFDTGFNIIVLGEAGAGKTTSLQMYVLNGERHRNKLCIYLPLGSLTQHWLKINKDLPDNERIKRLDEGIAEYLAFKGVSISTSQFSRELTKRQTVLLLDGVDEAIKLNSWLPEGLEFLSNKYKATVHIVVTSRMSGAYLDKIPFFAVTLLPFTEQQRDEFIKNWFDNDDKVIVKNISTHLKKNKSIAQIIKTPLLATTLCILAKNGIDLPNTELKLYNERLRLLTGYYDRVKNISTRIISTPQTLELVAQKIAFYLHQEAKREDDETVLSEKAIELTIHTLSKEDARTALKELIDPCNILVPMTDDGKFGFGHLRFQEHLAAREIYLNRSIDFLPLLTEPWWRGVLIFFSQMNTDLYWLIMDVIGKKIVEATKECLIDMINARPKTEQLSLTRMIEAFINSEKVGKPFKTE